MRIYEFGPFQLNAERLSLTADGEPVALGPRVVDTLLALVENAGAVVDKNALLDRVWPEGFVEEANLTQNIYVLRKALAARGLSSAIETAPRVGYRFIAPVHLLAAAREPAFRRRIVAALSAVAFAAASFALVASSGHGSTASATLSERGARLYQIGLYYWNLRTREGLQKSLTYFTQVTETDPLSAHGYAALADANVTMADYCYGTHRPAVYLARARAYADKALTLDPNSAEAYAALGFIDLWNKNVPRGMSELRRATALDPTYGPAHEWYGIALIGHGQRAEGMRHLRIAANVDPLSVTATAWLGSTALQNGRFDDAVAYSREALELAPQRMDALLTIGETYEAQGDYKAAIAAFERYASTNSYFRPEGAALLARAYALDRRIAQARAQFDFASKHVRQVNPVDLLAAAAAIGDRNAALQVLRGVRTHPMAFENAARAE
jgi:DNA-binding winged helix-turn-helix (wHTH) protein/Tfp pilus assembly protein PilF